MYQRCDEHVFVQEGVLWCTKGVRNVCLYRRWRLWCTKGVMNMCLYRKCGFGVRTETESLRLMKVVHRPEACMKDNA